VAGGVHSARSDDAGVTSSTVAYRMGDGGGAAGPTSVCSGRLSASNSGSITSSCSGSIANALSKSIDITCSHPGVPVCSMNHMVVGPEGKVYGI